METCKVIIKDLVRENNSTDEMNAAHEILPADKGCDNEEEEDPMDCEWDSDSMDSIFERSDYPCLFCKKNFINQEEVIEPMEICLGTDAETEVMKPICPYCHQIFKITDEIEEHIGIH